MAANLNCLTWGPLSDGEYEHMDCVVLVTKESLKDNPGALAVSVKGELPQVCPCDCKTCKRAWWADGKPVVRDGKIMRDPRSS